MHTDDPATNNDNDDEATRQSLVRAIRTPGWMEQQLEQYRRFTTIDLGVRVAERDREAAGSVVGSAVAFRLFLFFVPMLLFAVGLAGITSQFLDAEDFVDATGLAGALAAQIVAAFEQSSTASWFATLSGLIGLLWAGRSLSRTLVAASSLSWQLPIRPKATVRVTGTIVGAIVAFTIASAAINWIRNEFGIVPATMSFVVALGFYVITWLLLLLMLPRATPDPGASLPGALLIAAVLTGLQAVSQLYVSRAISQSSSLYGGLAASITTLGWFFFVGRTAVFAISVNAVLYERFGSISQLIFGLPVVRILPRRSPRLRAFFGLD
jgi:uncharacterized BrkB/YihY/UPF0761 family membrane protein